MALILREMSTTYGRSWAGFFWTIAEPVAGIVLLTALFSFMLRMPPMGVNFQIFYATGLIPFMFYQTVSAKVAQSIAFSRPLLGYPAVTFVDTLIARAIVSAATGIMVAYLVFAAILLMYETRTTLQVSYIAMSLAMAFVLAVGVGVLNCFLFARFPAWSMIWGVLMRPLMLVSCVLHIYDDVPYPYREYLLINPLVHVVGQMRRGFYQSYTGDYVSPTYVFLLGLGLMTVGLALLSVYRNQVINEW